MKFLNKKHEAFYTLNIEKTNSFNDPYRKALFYTLGLTEETRNFIERLYNFKERCIEFDGLKDPWQTGTSMRVTRLAFNLFNGFNGDIGEDKPIDDCDKYTPYNLFDTSLMLYMFEGIRLLYPYYTSVES